MAQELRTQAAQTLLAIANYNRSDLIEYAKTLRRVVKSPALDAIKLNAKSETIRAQLSAFTAADRDTKLARIEAEEAEQALIEAERLRVEAEQRAEEARIALIRAEIQENIENVDDVKQQADILENAYGPTVAFRQSPLGGNIYKINVDAVVNEDELGVQTNISAAFFRHNLPAFNNHLYCYYVISKNEDDEHYVQTVVPENNEAYTPENANNFFYGVLSKFYSIDYVWIQIYPRNAAPQDFELFESPDLNCVLKATITQHPELRKKVFNYQEALETKPVNKEILLELQTKFRLRYVIMSQVGTWFDTDPTDKKKFKQVKLYAHDNHASVYQPIAKRATKVVYKAHNELQPLLQQLHAPAKLNYNITINRDNGEPDFDLQSFAANDTVYKTYQVPAPDTNDPEYFNCNNEVSYQYKKFVNQNNLRPLTGIYFDIFRSADHHLTTQQFQQYSKKQQFYHSYDMNKAFPSFKHNPLYNQFKLTTGNVALFKNNNKDYLKSSGRSRICNVVYTNEIVKKTAWIQNDCWYGHIRLFYILQNNLATFDITHTVVSSAEDLALPFKPFDKDPDNKKFNNAFIGKPISGGLNNNVTQYYTAKHDYEINQLRYELTQEADVISAVPSAFAGLLEVVRKAETKNQLYQIHSDILDYQQTTFYALLTKVPISELVAFCVDGFYTTKAIPDFVSSTNPHEFKYEKSQIHFDSTYDAPIHKTFELPQDLTVPDISIYEQVLSPLSLTNGPPGCGKSYNSCESNPIPGTVILTPTHLLKFNHSQKTKLYVSTLHKFFGFGVSYHEQKIHENVVVDEITMVPAHLIRQMIAISLKYRFNLRFIGDIDEKGIHQRPPPKILGDAIKYTELINAGFSVKTEISPIRRQKTKDDCEFLDRLRTLSHNQIVAELRTRVFFIKSNEVPEYWTDDSTGVSATHERCKYFNKRVKPESPTAPARYVRNSSKTDPNKIKGAISIQSQHDIWFDRSKSDDKTPKNFNYEAAYFNTADAVQGATIKGPIFVDLTKSNLENFLYTAITRCEYLDNVYIIEN